VGRVTISGQLRIRRQVLAACGQPKNAATGTMKAARQRRSGETKRMGTNRVLPEGVIQQP
jgi:hypothetical protein